MDRDFQSCKTAAIPNVPVFFAASPAPVRAYGPGAFHNLIANAINVRQALIGGLGIPQVPQQPEEPPLPEETRRALTRVERRDGWNGGTDTMGASFNYFAGFGVEPGAEPGICHSELWARADLDADARVFGHHLELLRASAGAATQRTDLTAHLRLRVLGRDIFNANPRNPATFHFANSYRHDGLNWQEGWSFDILVVRLGVNLGVTGSLGYEYDVRAGLERNCAQERLALGVNGRMRPWADADVSVAGRASVVFNVAGAEVAARAKLIRAEVPVSADLAIETPSDLRDAYFRAGVRGDLNVETLAGRITIALWAFGISWGHDLLNWDGLRLNTNLLNERYQMELRRLFP
jgi:hypothetical protein